MRWIAAWWRQLCALTRLRSLERGLDEEIGFHLDRQTEKNRLAGMGTLLRSGEQLRVTAQLVEAPHGTLATSHTVQSSLGDLFGLQDDLARRIVEALSLPLTGGTPSPTPDRPHDARAYELYLRANELGRKIEALAGARDLYQECVALDSRFAPAWSPTRSPGAAAVLRPG